MTQNTQAETKKKPTPTLLKGTQSKASLPVQVSVPMKGAFTSNRLLHQQVLETAPPEAPLRLTLEELPAPLTLKAKLGKDAQIAEWLTTWIKAGFESGDLHENYLLPLKKELSDYLGVSVGTVQNAIRFVEDEGWVESKQRIGTLLKNASHTQEEQRIRKQTSKRDQTVLAIQQYIVNQGIGVNDLLPSSREMAKIIHATPNTTRLAMEFLTHEGVLEAMGNRGKKPNWTLKRLPTVENVGNDFASIQTDTLIDQIERELKALISERYEVNDKLPPHQELATLFKVSIKTVHDAMQRLAEQGMIHSKRGRYGTYVTRLPLHFISVNTMESLFMPAEQHLELYDYEKAYQALEDQISTFQSGEQLPNVHDLASEIGVTANSVRRGLKQLQEEGRVTFKRGRFGGAIVL
jgi:DNA-binding GntR family transcriptional regulator